MKQHLSRRYSILFSLVLAIVGGCGGGGGVADTEAPVIVLLGDNPQEIEMGSVYVEQGASAADLVDGDISASIVIDVSDVNTSIEGSYSVTYNVSDAAGNAAETKTRTVSVIGDLTPPVITILGDNPQTLEAGSDYIELGATSVDNIDGDITVSIIIDISTLNMAVPGTYSIIYISNDQAGNSSTSERTVNVVDTTKPEISLIGANPQTIEINIDYVELGATAVDNIDGDISDNIVIDASAVDVSVAGSYQVTYDVVDNAGNSALQRTRSVEVVEQVLEVTFFTGNTDALGYELYVTDGTTEGTNLVLDINPGVESSYPEAITVSGNKVIFTADNGTDGRALWKSDGTEAGTVLLKNISGGALKIYSIVDVNGIVYFRDEADFSVLWRTDGTSEGTVVIAAVDPQAEISQIIRLADIGGLLYFASENMDNSTSIWTSDGTDSGTQLVRTFGGSFTDWPSLFTDLNGIFYFTIPDLNDNIDLWKSDGTEQGTIKVRDLSGDSFNKIVTMNNQLFFMVNSALWKSDGTTDGTVIVKSIPLSDGTSEQIAVSNGAIYLAIQSEWWKSDGTTEGTIQFTNDVNRPYPLKGLNGNVLFRHNLSTSKELWISDGTEVGTKILKQINPDGNPSVDLLYSFYLPDGRLMFGANDGVNGFEPWVTDGTEEGTVLLKDINPGNGRGYGFAF